MAAMNITPPMEQTWRQLLADKGARFRRLDLVSYLTLLPRTTIRDYRMAQEAAQLIWSRAIAAGEIERTDDGPFWRAAAPGKRKLRSGREVTEHQAVQQLRIDARCPAKWISVDLETGDTWMGTPTGWTRADGIGLAEALDILQARIKDQA